MTRHELVSVDGLGIHDYRVVVRCVYTPGLVVRLFGARALSEERVYVGNASRWFALPGLDPVDHGTIMMLCRFVAMARIDRELKRYQTTRGQHR